MRVSFKSSSDLRDALFMGEDIVSLLLERVGRNCGINPRFCGENSRNSCKKSCDTARSCDTIKALCKNLENTKMEDALC